MDSLDVQSLQAFSTSEAALIRNVIEVSARSKNLVLEESSLADLIVPELRPYLTQVIVCGPTTILSSVVETRMIAEMSLTSAGHLNWGSCLMHFTQVERVVSRVNQDLSRAMFSR